MTRPADPSPPPDAAPVVKMVSLYQAQKKIYAKAITGRFNNWRWFFVWLTQMIFYGLPWLMWNDRQALLFELISRRFYIFGLVFYPQDLIYLTALLLVSAYGLFLFTAVSGRLWCGYACPQTVYTEIFMWIERKFEGDRVKRMKLDAAPWSAEKVWRTGGKHLAWIVVALWTGFTFVGYFTPIRELWASAMTLGFGPWEWFWVLFYGFATWGNAGFMREQVCKYMCPYARFQSAMFDRDTLIITYDAERGEPRGARTKKIDHKAKGLGDCVDCGLCVQVCPTGIDIRKGLQYECIGCAACIDACDTVMDKMGYARGLVRYDTENGLEQHLSRFEEIKRIFRPRVIIYSAVMVVICVGVGISIAMRSPFKADIVRDRASLARVVEDGFVENVYRVQVMNATETAQTYRLAVDGLPGLQLAKPVDVTVGPAEAKWVTVELRVPPETAAATKTGAHEIHFNVERLATASDEARVLREKSTFMLPR
ncbi:cytochrome c oxidase accessory protein CcoG [Sphaerotilus microaerophilus]|uniref:Ferredoxin n=1 Tax=Sphaerotilus microaerophilus TaxID=2914710 RepID=A0ABN6PNF6_9BURK|nr:cytochrome c oxidase accessory protein CcoG [Sphaerotilus sp. FB-5]BDI06751.1 ferredoxin [Sphaerotilus sp. FB-5]